MRQEEPNKLAKQQIKLDEEIDQFDNYQIESSTSKLANTRYYLISKLDRLLFRLKNQNKEI